MNEHLLKHLKNDPEYSLSEAERTLMRAELAELSRAPVTVRTSVPSPWFVYLMRPMPLAAFALILTISTTSVSFAAGGALPGDVLYPVKVRVNENVELALSPGIEAKAAVRVRHAEERLRETELLAAEGALTDEVAERAAAAVAKNVEAAVEAAASLREEGDENAAENLHGHIASALSAHAELLEAHAENFDAKPRETLRTLARAASDAVSRVETPIEDGGIDEARVRIAAEAAEDRAKGRLRDLAERLEKNGVADETELAFADEYARLASEFDATAEYGSADDFRNAAKTYESIDRRAYRALTFLTSAQRIGKKTDKEVVVVLESEAPGAMNAAPVALRAKTAAEPEAATMSLMMDEAVATGEAATTTSDMAEEAPHEPVEEAWQPRSERLQFWLRDRSDD
jgi:hypothetical protein